MFIFSLTQFMFSWLSFNPDSVVWSGLPSKIWTETGRQLIPWHEKMHSLIRWDAGQSKTVNISRRLRKKIRIREKKEKVLRRREERRRGKRVLQRVRYRARDGGFPGDARGKEPACWSRLDVRDVIFIPELGISQRRAWQPTPELLPGESHGQRSLAGCIP